MIAAALTQWGRHWDVLAESWRLQRAAERERSPRDETAFLPAALEVLETPPNPLGRIILWAMLAFIAIALAWSILGKVDMVAAAPGKVIPRGNVKLIQAADYGVVRALHVVEGQSVRAGQPLVDLDPTATGADVAQARQALLSADIDAARATALVDYAGGRSTAFRAPDGADRASVATQRAFVDAKRREQAATLQGLQQDRRQRQGELGMIESEMVKLAQQIPLAEERLAGMRSLASKGYAPRMKVSELEQTIVGMRQDLAIRRDERSKAQAAVAGVDQQIAKARGEFSREVLDALTEAQANRRLRGEELTKASDKAGLTVLTAPQDGVIQQMQVHTLGGVVKPADPLMVLVPKGGELIIEARVQNRDAGFVHEGQSVEIKLEAYPFTRYGVVHGVIEHIGRDAVQDEKEGLVFPAMVKLTQPWISVEGRRVPLAPGLAATVEIKTGERRIIGFLLSPLARRVKEGGRER
uniref:Membrane fusion protein (MFP) family protein n=1 Tax=Caulobacter sp. (strain K31) TaxID=366602 RepID=B0SXS6_CAUSK